MQVKAVEGDGVWLQSKDKPDLQKLTAATTVWATGIKMHPLSNAVAAAMPDGQQVYQGVASCVFQYPVRTHWDTVQNQRPWACRNTSMRSMWTSTWQ